MNSNQSLDSNRIELSNSLSLILRDTAKRIDCEGTITRDRVVKEIITLPTKRTTQTRKNKHTHAAIAQSFNKRLQKFSTNIRGQADIQVR